MSESKISENEFDLTMKSFGFFEKQPHLALSLSGGPDSMALFCLLKKWIVKNNATLNCFIVDHGLRKESENESNVIKNFVNKNKINCQILKWDGPKPKTNLMELARIKRYQLIIDACKSKSILHLLTAHHQDDQIETYFMRSQRLGNTTGFSCIPSIREISSLRIIRPLLNFKKERLVETCKYFNHNWITDSSNFNLKYERVRARNSLKVMEDVKKKKMLKIIKDSSIKKVFLNKKLAEFCYENLEFFPYGTFSLDQKKFIKLNKKLQIELIKKILTVNSGIFYPPKVNSVKFLIANILQVSPRTLTLHSSIIKYKNNKIFFYREKLKIENNFIVKRGEKLLWDNRFEITSNKFNVKLDKINDQNWSFVTKYFFQNKKRILPNFIIKTLPLMNIEEKFYIPFVTSMKLLNDQGVNFYFSPKISLT